jgi:UDP-GlcNAc:undecaprenyl-phosphate/decaprenyl-phosphate GlcNAc-1-phosphate transferase
VRPSDAVFAFFVACGAAAALTPLTARLARRLGAVDEPRGRGLSARPTPRLGGLAIFAAVVLAAALFVADRTAVRGILAGAALITLVGAIDDARSGGLPPGVKLLGQIAAALVATTGGVTANNVTIPFLGSLHFGDLGTPLTVLGLVAVMNVVNFSDGVDGLAAGVCAISGVAFTIIAFDLGRGAAAVLAALTAGAALGFLLHNFYPASVFMGDCGSNLLGYLLGCVTVYGSLKTNALIALVGPLVILAVPFLDTGFVIAKRLKYGRRVWGADTNHFHHRFARIGFSQRRTVLYLYAWSLVMGGLAVALRFVPYSDRHGHFHTAWSIVMGALLVGALGASVYLVYVLEILKFRRRRAQEIRTEEPSTSEWEIDRRVARDIDTGDFEAVGR